MDFVSEETERAGLGAAKYVNGLTCSNTIIRTIPGNGVRYVLPQMIQPSEEDISLFLQLKTFVSLFLMVHALPQHRSR